MLEIINLETCPFYNLALEEYCLDNFQDQDILILWQNIPTVVVGRNQNTIEEINSLCKRKGYKSGTQIIRRRGSLS